MKAYSNFDDTVGYCQGLSFVGGMLIEQLSEEKAFRLLCVMMFKLRLREQYMHDMGALKVQLYQFSRLVHDKLPVISTLLTKNGVEPFLYATPWFFESI